MKKSAVIFFVLLISISAYAQVVINPDPDTRRAREEMTKKEQKELDRAIRAEITDTIIDLHRFVLEANYIGDKYGNRIPVSPMLNFIIVDSTEAVMQFGNSMGPGINGVGGITFEGRVTSYEVKKKERKKYTGYTLTLGIMTSTGAFDVFLFAGSDGRADATISDNRGNKLRYYGDIIPFGASRTYKGRTVY